MARPPDHLSPRAREIVAVARRLLDEDGPDGVSMRRIAAELGIRASSLYKHIADKRALENAMISDGLFEQGDITREAVRDAEDPVLAIAMAFRRFAVEHPHLYRLITGRPLDQGGLVPGAEEYAGAALREALHGDRALGITLWAFAHGMVMLEIDGRFPVYADVEVVWRRGLAGIRGDA
ncbi:MAG: TetR family transcriptional regulator [Conexibacter sp.]|nr:TetR family transcriptional regulator [Conexibacter sp.]